MRLQTITKIENKGMFIGECPLPGETRAEGVYPGHPNGMQLSRDRFLIFYATRAHRGVDDDLSGIYQLRADSWDGAVLKEGFVARTQDDWDPLNEGARHVKQHGHPSGFGVPKGALIDGHRVPHENIFVAMWREVARARNPETGWLEEVSVRPDLWELTSAARWRHFRLNDAGDDIEWLTEVETMRLPGQGTEFLKGRPDVVGMIKGFVPAVPLDDSCTAWIDLNSACKVGGANVGSSKSRGVLPGIYRFNSKTSRYEWNEVGPLSEWGLYEAAVARRGKQIVYMARASGTAQPLPPEAGKYRNHVHYHTTETPIEPELNFIPAFDQPSSGPRSFFTGPDGRFWKLGGSVAQSPYGEERNPIYMEEILPEEGFRVGERHLILDGEADNPGIPLPVWIDFPKLLPHTGGTEQWMIFRVRGIGLSYSPEMYETDLQQIGRGERRPGVPFIRMLTEEEFRHTGIYAAKVHYREPQSAAWSFASL